jgi:AcrR family transcriptional regulator
VTNLVTKLLAKTRRRRRLSSEKHAHKGEAATQAVARLLALHDYDAISMAKIAQEAGCSVGAMYARFSDKDNLLYHVIASVFRSLSNDAVSTLDPSLDPRESALVRVDRLGRHIVESMTGRKAAGVIRASIKLATVMPMAIEPFEAYRKVVSDQAVALLSPKLPKTSPEAIRIAVQIVIGTVTDAILQKKPGPMSAGTPRMIQALTHVMAGYLGVSGKSWAGTETEGKDDKPIHDELTEEPPEDGSQAVFESEFRRYSKRRVATPAKTQRAMSKPDQARPALPSSTKGPAVTGPKPGKTQGITPQSGAATIKEVKQPKVRTPPPEPPSERQPPKRKRRLV